MYTRAAATDAPKALGFLNIVYQGKKVGTVFVEDAGIHEYLMENEKHQKFFLEDSTTTYNPNVKKELSFSFRRA